MNRKIVFAFMILAAGVICTGCDGSSLDELVPVRDLSYNRIEKNTALVVRGDITPAFDKPLELVGYEEKRYRENSDEFEALEEALKLKIKSVNCQVGEQVKKGDVLVSFTSEELDRQIKDKEEEKRLAKLELEHIKKLAKLDTSSDYSGRITGIKQQIKICDLYIQDINDKYGEINIICEEDGAVRYINPSLYDGYVVTNNDLIIVSRDAGYYEAKVDDTVSFDPEKTYEAGSGAAKYELRVMDDALENNDENNNNGNNNDANDKNEGDTDGDPVINENGTHTIYFKPVNSDGKMLEKTILMEAELDVVKDVCYVDKQAIISKESGDYVYMVDEEGRRRAISVKKGDIVGDYCIILDGLTGGERVTLP